MPDFKYSFYNRTEYFNQLITIITQVREPDRIVLASMPLDTRQHLVLKIMDALTNAAKRNVKVLLIIDAFTFLLSDKSHLGPLWHSKSDLITNPLAYPFDEYLAALQKLRTAGGKYVITNKPSRSFSIPHSGRSHIKFAVINNMVYIGGHNLSDSSELDIMTSFRNSKLADWLSNLGEEIALTGNVRVALNGQDCRTNVGQGLDLFVDAGLPKQSLILDQAVALVKRSKQWVFLTCQYFPGGKIGQALLDAQHRGVKVQIIYNHPSAHHIEAIGHYIYNLTQRTKYPKNFFEYELHKHTPKLHAKLIASENEAMLGSHNYVGQGVRLGTAEIALRIQDSSFSKNAVESVTRLLPLVPKFLDATHLNL